MSQDHAARILVSRTVVRRLGEGYETLTLKVETTVPPGTGRQEFLSDLEATTSRIISKTAGTSPTQNPITAASSQVPVTKPIQSDDSKKPEFDSTISTHDGETLAQVTFQESTLTVSIVDEFKLRYDAGPVQSFLIPRVLNAMQHLGELHGYDFVTNEGYLSGIYIELPTGLAEPTVKKHVKRLIGAITWTLRTLSERSATRSNGEQ